MVKSRNTNRIYSRKKPLVNRYGVQFPNQKLTPETRMVVWQRFMAGEEAKDLGEEFGVSVHRVFVIVSEHKKRIKAINEQTIGQD